MLTDVTLSVQTEMLSSRDFAWQAEQGGFTKKQRKTEMILSIFGFDINGTFANQGHCLQMIMIALTMKDVDKLSIRSKFREMLETKNECLLGS